MERGNAGPIPGSLDDDSAVWEASPTAIAELDYGIEDRPGSLWESLLYGWQHTLVDISPFVLPLAVAGALGLSAADSARLINFSLFGMGLATLIQTTVGNRLPIVQGPSATLTGTLVPVARQMGPGPMWGAVLVGGLVEMVVGASRVLRYLRRLFPASVSGVVVVSIGLALGRVAVEMTFGQGRGVDLLLAGAVLASIVFLQVRGRRWLGGLAARGAVFLSIWLIGVGVAGPLGEVDWALVADRPWFQLPRPFPFGGPGFGWELGWAAVLAVLAGYLGSMVESIGDYAATCAAAGETFRVRHMNRGIFAEGLGSVVAATFGGLPCTSYTQNVGIIAATRVASRFVVRIAGGILALYGLCPKFGALLVALPRPVLGGVFVVVCGMIVSSGVRLLATVEGDAANSLLLGTTLVTAVTVPVYVENVLGDAWLAGLPAFLRLLTTNTVVLAVITAVSLNAILQLLLGDERDDG